MSTIDNTDNAWKEVIRNNDRYKDFTIYDAPILIRPFSEIFKDKDIDLVQVHSIETYNTEENIDIVGFIGSFSWIDNRLKSIDGDSYDENMLIYGYNWWSNPYIRIDKALDILVKDF